MNAKSCTLLVIWLFAFLLEKLFILKITSLSKLLSSMSHCFLKNIFIIVMGKLFLTKTTISTVIILKLIKGIIHLLLKPVHKTRLVQCLLTNACYATFLATAQNCQKVLVICSPNQ